MPRVNVEGRALTDRRFVKLGRLLGAAGSERVQHGAGIGIMAFVWDYCTVQQRTVLTPGELEDVTGVDGFGSMLLTSGLGRQDSDGIYVCGSPEGIAWYGQILANAKKGGDRNRERLEREKRAKDSLPASQPPSRQDSRQDSRQATQEASRAPSQPASPLALAPSPALAPAPSVEILAADEPPQGGTAEGSSQPSPDDAKPKACCKDGEHRAVAVEFRFCGHHRKRYGVPYTHEQGRDRKALGKLPDAYDRAMLLGLVDQFWLEAEADEFTFRKRGVSIPAFVGRVPALLESRRQPARASPVATNERRGGLSSDDLLAAARRARELEGGNR